MEKCSPSPCGCQKSSGEAVCTGFASKCVRCRVGRATWHLERGNVERKTHLLRLSAPLCVCVYTAAVKLTARPKVDRVVMHLPVCDMHAVNAFWSRKKSSIRYDQGRYGDVL